MSAATHHIFFAPRLEIVLLQQHSDGFATDVVDQFAFHRLRGDQPDTPAGLAVGSRPAHHGDNALRFGFAEQGRGTGTGTFLERV